MSHRTGYPRVNSALIEEPVMGIFSWLAPGLADGHRPRDSIIRMASPLLCHLGHQSVRYGRPQDRAPVSDRGLVVPVDGRSMISTGVGITLVVAGAIVRFAVPATFTYGLDAHVVSVIVMLAGVFGCGVPLPGNGPAMTSRQRDVRRSRDRESALPEGEHRAAHRVL
jgi:hypothetical protein